MTPDPRQPIEPAPRFADGPPPFVPPPRETARGAGTRGPEPPPRPVPSARRGPVSGAWSAALLAAGIALAVYAWGAAPYPQAGDSAELATVAVMGGVPHSPGYPTFALLGRVAGALLQGEPSYRIALFCAFFGAVSVALFALLLAELGLAWGAILGGALFYAGTFSLWWASIRVEVYALGAALALFALWRVLVARRTLHARDGLAAAFAIGLAMTVHLSFGPALAVAGLMLMQRARSAGVLTPARVLGTLVMLLLGLSPYLYLPFADQHSTLTNYLWYTVEAGGGQYGLSSAQFDSPMDRLWLLFSGPDTHPYPLWDHLPTALQNLGVAWARFAAFEVGPLGLMLAIGGEGALARRDRGAARLLAGIALLTPAFGCLLVGGALLNMFMMASTMAVAALAACGIEALLARGGTRAPLAVGLALAAILVPHELRLRADVRPIGPAWLHMEEEGPPHIRTFVPQLRHERAALDQALATLAQIPESSFVAAKWEPITMLKYLQSARGMRPDLTLDPWYEPSHVVRLARWQRSHSLATHPVVVVNAIPGLIDRLHAPEAVHVLQGTTLYIERGAVDTTLAMPARPGR